MKKNERTKMKLEKIDRIKRNLAFNKSVLKKNLTCARSDSKFKGVYRTAAKEGINAIHSDLFTLRAVEKQIPMPVKIQIPPREPERTRYAYKNGKKVLVIVYEAWCQNCNKLIDFGNKPSEAYDFTIRYKGYCSRCGQKLWWPSC